MAAAEATHADDPERAEMIARARRFKASWFELAESLTQLRRDEAWRRWGFADFESYCKKELHLKPDTVDKLTGSFAFLRARAPEVLRRDGREAPLPTYQAVDFLRRVEEESDAPPDTIREIRRKVLDEGTELPKLSRVYRQVVFPVDEDDARGKKRAQLRQSVDKIVELLALAREEGWVPATLCAEIEEPLQRLQSALQG
jgi:hypothetical protein